MRFDLLIINIGVIPYLRQYDKNYWKTKFLHLSIKDKEWKNNSIEWKFPSIFILLYRPSLIQFNTIDTLIAMHFEPTTVYFVPWCTRRMLSEGHCYLRLRPLAESATYCSYTVYSEPMKVWGRAHVQTLGGELIWVFHVLVSEQSPLTVSGGRGNDNALASHPVRACVLWGCVWCEGYMTYKTQTSSLLNHTH